MWIKRKQYGPFIVLGKIRRNIFDKLTLVWTHKKEDSIQVKDKGAMLKSKEILGTKALNPEQVCYSHGI